MNNLADITTLPEDQVALALNLDFEQDGSVYSRPAIVLEDPGPRPFTLVDINRAIDPSFESAAGIVGVPGTTGVQSAPALVADNPLAGTNSSRVAWTTASTAAFRPAFFASATVLIGLAVLTKTTLPVYMKGFVKPIFMARLMVGVMSAASRSAFLESKAGIRPSQSWSPSPGAGSNPSCRVRRGAKPMICQPVT